MIFCEDPEGVSQSWLLTAFLHPACAAIRLITNYIVVLHHAVCQLGGGKGRNQVLQFGQVHTSIGKGGFQSQSLFDLHVLVLISQACRRSNSKATSANWSRRALLAKGKSYGWCPDRQSRVKMRILNLPIIACQLYNHVIYVQ